MQVREAQATEELTATAAMLVELKARAAQGQAESAKHKQEVQALRQEYRTMAVNLDDKVSRAVQWPRQERAVCRPCCLCVTGGGS